MSYTIRFEGCGSTSVRAPTRPAALSAAQGLMARGRRGVVVLTPEGGQIPLAATLQPTA